MALPSLATVTQLAEWMQVDPGTLPASAGSTLEMVSAIVRAEARQSFTRGTSTVTLFPREGWAYLPQRPVVSVASVTSDGSPITNWELERDRLWIGCGVWAVTVTFTHGYTVVPGDVLAIVLSAASRGLSNPRDYRQRSVGSSSVTYAAETIGVALAPSDRDLLARYRRRTAVVGLK